VTSVSFVAEEFLSVSASHLKAKEGIQEEDALILGTGCLEGM